VRGVKGVRGVTGVRGVRGVRGVSREGGGDQCRSNVQHVDAPTLTAGSLLRKCILRQHATRATDTHIIESQSTPTQSHVCSACCALSPARHTNRMLHSQAPPRTVTHRMEPNSTSRHGTARTARHSTSRHAGQAYTHRCVFVCCYVMFYDTRHVVLLFRCRTPVMRWSLLVMLYSSLSMCLLCSMSCSMFMFAVVFWLLSCCALLLMLYYVWCLYLASLHCVRYHIADNVILSLHYFEFLCAPKLRHFNHMHLTSSEEPLIIAF